MLPEWPNALRRPGLACLMLGPARLAGLAGQNVTGADLIVGMPARAAVAAQIGGGLSLDALFARQTEPALQLPRVSPGSTWSGCPRARSASSPR
jgi:hypothetical protein